MQEKISKTICPPVHTEGHKGGRRASRACLVLVALCYLVVGGSVEYRADVVATESLAELKQLGRLRVALPQGYLQGFARNADSAGFEHDLLRRFAESRGVELQIVRVSHPQQAVDRLRRGDVHLAAGNLSETVVGDHNIRVTSAFYDRPYRIVSSPEVGLIDDPYQLVGKRVVVTADSNAIGHLKKLTAEVPVLRWQIDHGIDVDSLLTAVAAGAIEATVVDSLSATVLKQHYADIQLGYEFGESHQMVWALRDDGNHALLLGLDEFLNNARSSGLVDRIEERYLDAARQNNHLDRVAFRKRVLDTLPRYRHQFVEAATKTDQDWRLLAALSYQESMWNPDAVSPTGVRGMMQLTKDTATLLDVDRDDVTQSIDGGAKYLRRLRDRLPPEITEPDRTWLALASYNLGPGHVDDAIAIAQNSERGRRHSSAGANWLAVKQILPKLEDPKFAATTKFGRARGNEALTLVARTRSFYEILTRMEDFAETDYRAISNRDVSDDASSGIIAVSTAGHAITRNGVEPTRGGDINPALPAPIAISELAPQARVKRPLASLDARSPSAARVTTTGAAASQGQIAQASVEYDLAGQTKAALNSTGLWPSPTSEIVANASGYWYLSPVRDPQSPIMVSRATKDDNARSAHAQ